MQATTYKQNLINFLNENVQAAAICLSSKPVGGTGYKENDVLGFPAATLLLSVIDAIGTIRLGSNKSFQILGLSPLATEDLYKAYRNPFLHNNILLEGRFLFKDDSSDDSFIMNDEKVIGINLSAFLKLCRSMVANFEKEVTDKDVEENTRIKQNMAHSIIGTFEKFFIWQEKSTKRLEGVGSSDLKAQVEILHGAPLSGHVELPRRQLDVIDSKHD